MLPWILFTTLFLASARRLLRPSRIRHGPSEATDCGIRIPFYGASTEDNRAHWPEGSFHQQGWSRRRPSKNWPGYTSYLTARCIVTMSRPIARFIYYGHELRFLPRLFDRSGKENVSEEFTGSYLTRVQNHGHTSFPSLQPILSGWSRLRWERKSLVDFCQCYKVGW